MQIKSRKILVLAPHTDDAEFGMGATIARFIEEENEVYCAAFSACRQSVQPGFPEDILITEVKQAAAVLGIASERLFLFDYPVRTFNIRRQELLDNIIRLRDNIRPDYVFMPSVNDIHQDHYTLAQEGVRAFKFSSLLCYELPWNNFSFQTSCFFEVDETQLQRKIDAVSCYRSQQHRQYASADFIRSLAVTRGVQTGAPLAECFEVVRLVNRLH